MENVLSIVNLTGRSDHESLASASMLSWVKQTESLTLAEVMVKDLANDQLKAANLALYTVLFLLPTRAEERGVS